jgi:hypothetical protein
MTESMLDPEALAARRARTRRLSLLLGLFAVGVYAAFIYSTFLHSKH